MNAQTHKALTGFFGRCFLLCVGFQLLALGLFLGLHDRAYEIHSALFTLTPEQFDLACYTLLGAMKTLGLAFFLVPWMALKTMSPTDAT